MDLLNTLENIRYVTARLDPPDDARADDVQPITGRVCCATVWPWTARPVTGKEEVEHLVWNLSTILKTVCRFRNGSDAGLTWKRTMLQPATVNIAACW